MTTEEKIVKHVERVWGNTQIAHQMLIDDLHRLVGEWEKLGIDPNAFITCGECHELFVDEEGNDIPCRCDRKDTALKRVLVTFPHLREARSSVALDRDQTQSMGKDGKADS